MNTCSIKEKEKKRKWKARQYQKPKIICMFPTGDASFLNGKGTNILLLGLQTENTQPHPTFTVYQNSPEKGLYAVHIIVNF